MTSRYGVFYAPPSDSALWAFGSSVIGYDAESGGVPAHFDGAPCSASEWRALTSEPRRYGFHATLKAPFALPADSSEDDLLAAARAFASRQQAFGLPRLRVSTIGAFVALTPAVPSKMLDDLAAESVRAFERLRAPLTRADRERRLAAPLTRRQSWYLDEWGYPYVFEDFRFHMSLTGPLPEPLREPVRADLQRRLDQLDQNLAVDAIAIFRQRDQAGRFRVLARLPFGDAAAFRRASPRTPRSEAS